MTFHAIIPAGGYGRRLWPVSTPRMPKFLQAIGSDFSLAQLAALRLAPLTDSLTFITGAAPATELFNQVSDVVKDKELAVVVEPQPRDSMAAIGLGAALLEARYGSCIVGSFAADHLLHDEDAFAACLRTAVSGAQQGFLVTIGITPTAPATGFGYIEVGQSLSIPGLRAVRLFREKPSVEVAQQYLRSGGYLWNAGMFVVRSDVLLDALETQAPGSGAALRELAAGWDSLDTKTRETLWRKVVKAPIDTVLAEPLAAAGQVAVVPAPAGIGWSDVGDWESVYQQYAQTPSAPLEAAPSTGHAETVAADKISDSSLARSINLSPQVPLYTESSSGSLVKCDGLEGVAIIGIPNAVIVLHEGKLLVTTRENAQKVKDASLAADDWGSLN